MTAQIIDGKKIADNFLKNVKIRIDNLKLSYNIIPCLAIIQVGDNLQSSLYIKNKIKKCNEIGIDSKHIHLNADILEQSLLAEIQKLNNDVDVHGIIVQLPLPKNICVTNIINAIHPSKDVDGFHPENVGKLVTNQKCFVPCTPQGCMILLQSAISNFSGLKAVVLGRSNIVGRPMASLLLQYDCSVVMLHSHSANIQEECKTADIIVAAVGKKQMVKRDWVKPGAVIIDVGINYIDILESNKICGDTDFEQIKHVAKAITPVPGGVGPMTIACLISNTVLAAENSYLTC
jgi:methylenetetrahydrofolate dehydrogenase (NADP+)/methenyltetrahydrofolate cyclohydrolase